MPHDELQLRQIAEMDGVVTRKGVAAHIRYPAGKPSRTTECLPAVLPIARHPAILPSHARQRTQRNHTPAACLALLRSDNDLALLPAHIIGSNAGHLGRAYTTIQQQAERKPHIAEPPSLRHLIQPCHLFIRKRLNHLFLRRRHINPRQGIRITPLPPHSVRKNAVQNRPAPSQREVVGLLISPDTESVNCKF